MNNARINTLNGKSLPVTNIKTFGQTISDRQTDPNIIQTTFVPDTVDGTMTTMQQFNFSLLKSIKTVDAGITPAVEANSTSFYLIPELTLESHKHYQFKCEITLILRPVDSTTYKSGYWEISAAAKDTTFIGEEGYVLTTTSSDNGIETYVPNSAITLSITGNKFKISIVPIDDIAYSADLFVNVKIKSCTYSHAA